MNISNPIYNEDYECKIDCKVVRQHFVSQFYLKNWRIINPKNVKKDIIFRLNLHELESSKNRIQSIPIDRSNVQSNFYTVKVTDKSLEFLKKYYLDKPYSFWYLFVSMEMKVLNQIEFFRKIDDHEQKFGRKLDILNSNFLENHYCTIEKRASDFLNKIHNDLLNKNNTRLEKFFLLPDMIRRLIYWISTQYFRTVKVRTEYKSRLSRFNDLNGSDIETIAAIMAYVNSIDFAENLLYLGINCNFYIIPEAKFITTDAPVYFKGQSNVLAKGFEIIFPISPYIVLYIVPNKAYITSKKKININTFYLNSTEQVKNMDDIVNCINNKLCMNADKFVFANNRESLEILCL